MTDEQKILKEIVDSEPGLQEVFRKAGLERSAPHDRLLEPQEGEPTMAELHEAMEAEERAKPIIRPVDDDPTAPIRVDLETSSQAGKLAFAWADKISVPFDISSQNMPEGLLDLLGFTEEDGEEKLNATMDVVCMLCVSYAGKDGFPQAALHEDQMEVLRVMLYQDVRGRHGIFGHAMQMWILNHRVLQVLEADQRQETAAINRGLAKIQRPGLIKPGDAGFVAPPEDGKPRRGTGRLRRIK